MTRRQAIRHLGAKRYLYLFWVGFGEMFWSGLIPSYRRHLEAVEFYADPDTYFAIGIFPDPPCGDFIEDFSETELGYKPGRMAREALRIELTS